MPAQLESIYCYYNYEYVHWCIVEANNLIMHPLIKFHSINENNERMHYA